MLRKQKCEGQKVQLFLLCSSHPVQVGVGIFWHVVVEDDIDSLDVHPSAKEVGGHQDPPLEVLELLIARQPGGVGDGVKKGQRGGRSQREAYQHSCWGHYWTAPPLKAMTC